MIAGRIQLTDEEYQLIVSSLQFRKEKLFAQIPRTFNIADRAEKEHKYQEVKDLQIKMQAMRKKALGRT